MTSFKRHDDTLRRIHYGDHPPACTCVKCNEKRRIGDVGRREETKMKRSDVKYGLIVERNRLVIIIIAFVALAIVNSQAFKFPNATDHLIGHYFIGNAIKTGILFIMLPLVMTLRNYLRMVVSYYMHTGYKIDNRAESIKIARNIDILANGLVNIVAIAITWAIVIPLVNQLLLIEGSGSLDWIDLVFNISFALFLAYTVIITLGSFPVVLGITAKKSKKIPCPNCGTSNLSNAKFCISCGAAIQSTQNATGTSRCTKCGTENKSDSKFCENCGMSLASP